MLTQSVLKQTLNYDPETGVFTRREPRLGKAVGSIAGTINAQGYRVIGIQKKYRRASHLAWLWVHGCLPPEELDHINGNQADDRIANLRLATSAQNKWNTRLSKNSTSGLKGVFWHKQNKYWRAQIMRHGKLYHLGVFHTKEEAHAAYCEAARKLHGEFARTK